jgi:hypothetical protein
MLFTREKIINVSGKLKILPLLYDLKDLQEINYTVLWGYQQLLIRLAVDC